VSNLFIHPFRIGACVNSCYFAPRRWFWSWCKASRFRPVFPAVQLGTLLATGKKGKKTTKKRLVGDETERRDETECFSHLVLDLAPAPPLPERTGDGYTQGAATGAQNGSRAASTVALPRLSNGRLLERRDGAYHLRSSAFVVPYAANRPAAGAAAGAAAAGAGASSADRNAHALLEYVLVPYALGQQLYDAYDPNAPHLPSPHFKRCLFVLEDAVCVLYFLSSCP
jgi:hypothetical protein